jgi:hypothetical protein
MAIYVCNVSERNYSENLPLQKASLVKNIALLKKFALQKASLFKNLIYKKAHPFKYVASLFKNILFKKTC